MTIEEAIIDAPQTEIVQMLENNSIGFVAATYKPTQIRQQRFQFSSQLWENEMQIVMRRAENKMQAYFDLFNVFNSDLWLAILFAFLVNILLGIAFLMLERRYISRDPIAPIEVCITNYLYSSKLKREILVYLQHVAASNRQNHQFEASIAIRFVDD